MHGQNFHCQQQLADLKREHDGTIRSLKERLDSETMRANALETKLRMADARVRGFSSLFITTNKKKLTWKFLHTSVIR
jgi:hypothetical protein